MPTFMTTADSQSRFRVAKDTIHRCPCAIEWFGTTHPLTAAGPVETPLARLECDKSANHTGLHATTWDNVKHQSSPYGSYPQLSVFIEWSSEDE